MRSTSSAAAPRRRPAAARPSGSPGGRMGASPPRSERCPRGGRAPLVGVLVGAGGCLERGGEVVDLGAEPFGGPGPGRPQGREGGARLAVAERGIAAGERPGDLATQLEQ